MGFLAMNVWQLNLWKSLGRQSLVVSLLAGLAVGGLPPCLLTGDSCAAAVAHRPASTCCCQGKCGGHCHMACCQSPAPSQERPAAPPRLSDEHSVTWGLVAGATGTLDSAATADFSHGNSHLAAWPATCGSLLILGVRFNV